MKELHYRKCTVSDLDTLTEIAKTTFLKTFGGKIAVEDFQKYVERAFSREVFLAQLMNENSYFYFGYAEGTLAGYFKLNTGEAQKDLRDGDGAELERIYLLEPFQGKGLGKVMLNKAIALARDFKATYLWLGVWENNRAAIGFYERHGFRKFGEHASIMHPEIAPDWLMRKEL